MNQKLRLLLQNHFNWSFEFSNDMNLLLEHKKLLEQYLTGNAAKSPWIYPWG